MGEEVMAQAPLSHPTNFQYKKPAIAPTGIPIKVSLCLIIKFLILSIIFVVHLTLQKYIKISNGNCFHWKFIKIFYNILIFSDIKSKKT